jgi:D-alanyl-D-alanine dipeptidase
MIRIIISGAMALLITSCAIQPDELDDGRENFVYVVDVIPDVVLDVRYYSEDNFVGTRVDGYRKPVVLISKSAGQALLSVQESLRQQGLGLKIFDAYRPQKAVDHFVRWAADPADTLTKAKYYPELPKGRLFDLGYISARSGHTRGSTGTGHGKRLGFFRRHIPSRLSPGR